MPPQAFGIQELHLQRSAILDFRSRSNFVDTMHLLESKPVEIACTLPVYLIDTSLFLGLL